MIQYDHDYYYNLLKIHNQTAPDIVNIRYKFIHKNVVEPLRLNTENMTLLDYGCGIGYMKALAPTWMNYENIDTYDIMPVPQTGISRARYHIVTMYDVLEHIPDFMSVSHIFKKGYYVFITVPVKPDNVKWKDYKHFKPGEHIHYFTDDLIIHMFEFMGFDLISSGTPECPPREYVKTYAFKNKDVDLRPVVK